MITQTILLTIALAPLVGAVLVGFLGGRIGRTASHWIAILGVALSTALSFKLLWLLATGEAAPYNANVYTFFDAGGISAHVGFMIDTLSATMMAVVSFVSLLVHIYTIGYMADDEGYTRFFSYISLFTFAMLMLVMSNNFMQLFFGWEAVGLVSYLLIGFWFKRPTAVFANLKAFLVNRVGDVGFLIGIAGALYWLGSLDYATAFANTDAIAGKTFSPWEGAHWSIATFIGICLFIGAMGKSAQVPLHVWLPDSMEGPTPISALIHAATMVTAGIFMVARMSPIFELSATALGFVLFIGATTAFFTGLIGIVQNDIKRVVAYSTLSQLGYMTVALGVSAYSAAIFHLMTHAFFKALLFLGAGSVIIAMHHEQDMRRMGGLRKYLPITWLTMWAGTLALVGTPFFSGYFSQDSIILAAQAAAGQGGWVQQYAYWAVLLGVFVTSVYSFRLMYLTFHGKERFREVHAAGAGHDVHEHHDAHAHEPHETPLVVTVPLTILAIFSIVVGFITVGPMLFGGFFDGAIVVSSANDTVAAVKGMVWHGDSWVAAAVGYGLHFVASPVFWLTAAGFALTTWIYLFNPAIATRLSERFNWLYHALVNKLGFDVLWIQGLAGGSVRLGNLLWKRIDAGLIDGFFVNGSVALVDRVAGIVRVAQTGRLYHYAFVMIVGLSALLGGLILALR